MYPQHLRSGVSPTLELGALYQKTHNPHYISMPYLGNNQARGGAAAIGPCPRAPREDAGWEELYIKILASTPGAPTGLNFTRKTRLSLLPGYRIATKLAMSAEA